MTALDRWDFAMLELALNMLDHHAEVELANAITSRKRASMLAMRRQIVEVRAKLKTMQ